MKRTKMEAPALPAQDNSTPSKKPKFLKKPTRFSRNQMMVFALIFAAIGVYILIKTFAAAPAVGSLEAETMSASVPSTASAVSSTGFSTTLTNGMTLKTPYLWTFDPGVSTSAGYFWADGKLLSKVTGPGPYVLRLNANMLSSGTHNLGHAWDTTAGQHQTPTSSYSATVSNVAGSGFVTTLVSGSTMVLPATWAFDPGVSTSAGYFWADGKLLSKVTGPGPYVLKVSSSMLSSGAHALGHAWDTTAGQHKAPPSNYNLQVSDSQPAVSGYSVVSDSTASGGKAMKIGGGVSLSGSVSLSNASGSMTVIAHGEQCSSGIWPQLSVTVDGKAVINASVISGAWTNYSANLSLTSGSHSLLIKNTSSGPCLPNLYVDSTTFYGAATSTPAPTVTLSATPNSINSGQSAMLNWTSTNATSCKASGAWTNSNLATSGSQSTGNLSQTATYSLSCTGSGGTATTSVTVTVSVTTSNNSSYNTAIAYSDPSNRPAFNCTRTVNVTTASQLTSAINNLQAGDCVINTQSGGFSVPGEISISKNLSSYALIDLKTGTNAVRFTGGGTQTPSSDLPSVYIHNSSNIKIYGGNITNNRILIYNPTSNFTWWNFYAHDLAGDGADLFPAISGGGDITNVDIQGEINHWGINCAVLDPHAEKCTGIHGINVADASQGKVTNSRIAIYAHDSASGAGMEIGIGSTSAGAINNTIYLKCVNLTMKAVSQVAGNCVQVWGDNVTGNHYKYIEATNLQGRPYDANGLYSGQSLSTDVVEYGIASNTNLNSQMNEGLAQNVKWDTRGNTTFQNVSPKP